MYKRQEYLLKLINTNIHLIYSSLIHQTVFILIGLFILFIALYIIWLKQKMVQLKPYIKVVTESGEIKISLYSLEQIILNILNEVKDVRKIKPEIQLQKEGTLKTTLQLSLIHI